MPMPKALVATIIVKAGWGWVEDVDEDEEEEEEGGDVQDDWMRVRSWEVSPAW